MMTLYLTKSVMEAMKRHVLSTYPEEGCGVLVGRHRDAITTVVDAIPLKNVASELRTRRYKIDPLEFLRASDAAERNGSQIVGIFHSHPHHPSIPSEHDLDHAWPNISYVILAVDGQDVTSIQSWRLTSVGSSKEFMEEKIHVQ